MQYIAGLLRASIVIIGIYMMVKNPSMTPPFLSGLAFILIGLSLCVNRILAAQGAPCLIKCFNKKK